MPDNNLSAEMLDELENFPRIENLELISLLGKGGTSRVYKARQLLLDRIVAVKVILVEKMSEEAVQRFQNEARLSSKLKHPNIVRVLSFGLTSEGFPYLVLEFLEGLSLEEHLKQNGRLSLHRFKDIFVPILSALEHAHGLGLIHRDIKPANITLTKNSEGQLVKLVDFGMAKMFIEDQVRTYNFSKTGKQYGTPAYMSPEQCLGQSMDARSDLYSLACVMYQSLTGNLLYSSESQLEIMNLQRIGQVPTASELCKMIELPSELASAIVSALSKDPALRPQSAAEMSSKIVRGLDSITSDSLPRLKSNKRSGLNKAATATCAILVIILLAALPHFLQKSNKNSGAKRLREVTVVSHLDRARTHLHESEISLKKGSVSRTVQEADKAINALAQHSKKGTVESSKEILPLLERLVPVYAWIKSPANDRVQRNLTEIADNSKLQGDLHSRFMLALARIHYYCENGFDCTISYLQAFQTYYLARDLDKCRALVLELRSLNPSGDRAGRLLSIAVNLCQGFVSCTKHDTREANKNAHMARELIDQTLVDDPGQRFKVLRILFRLEQLQADLHSARSTALEMKKIAEKSPNDQRVMLEALLKDSTIAKEVRQELLNLQK